MPQNDTPKLLCRLEGSGMILAHYNLRLVGSRQLHSSLGPEVQQPGLGAKAGLAGKEQEVHEWRGSEGGLRGGRGGANPVGIEVTAKDGAMLCITAQWADSSQDCGSTATFPEVPI
ncbi:hypothetical protein AAY473_010441 [Plecturocebus cupreus]